MMELYKKIAVAVVLSSLTVGAIADGDTPATTNQGAAAQKTPNFFADCGIGGAIFKNDIGGVLSNIIWDFGLTATTSGLSSPDTCEGADVVAATFIHHTYSSLEEETAIGEGEHLSALLDIFACSEESKDQATQSIRAGFSSILNKADYSESSSLEKSQAYFDLVKTSASNCNA